MNKKLLLGLIFIGTVVVGSSVSAATAAPLAAKKYACVNDPSVKSRAYVALLGLNDNDVDGLNTRMNELTSADPKAKAVWVYDYTPTDTLATISADFTKKFNKFAKTQNVDEVLIFGRSAGGTILASSAHNLKVPGKAEIHTIASPLKGYGLKGFLEYFLGDKKGFTREIGQGFTKFKSAPKRLKVFHHKTVTDNEYAKECGQFASVCPMPKSIQNNNLFGSREFFYPEHDHDTIMDAVTKLVIACRK